MSAVTPPQPSAAAAPESRERGAGLSAALIDRVGLERDGWPAVVVVHDRPATEQIVENLEAIIDSLITAGHVGFACDLGDVRDLFEDALHFDRIDRRCAD